MIRQRIVQLDISYNIREVTFDPYGATEMVAKLMHERLKMVEFRQNTQTFNKPTQKLEALIANGHIEPGGNPVPRPHAQAATVKTDLNENIRLVKDRTTGRLDGIVALITAIARHQTQTKHARNARSTDN